MSCIVAACPGNRSCNECYGNVGVKRMLARVPGVEVLLLGVWQLDPIGGCVDPVTGELIRLVVVLAARPGCHLRGLRAH